MAQRSNRGPLRALSFAGVVLVAVVGFAGAGAAQDGGSSSSTTQLDLGGESTTTTAPGSTPTTQLDLGGDSAPSVAGDSTTAPQPPTRVDAGAGGAAPTDTSVPLGLVGLAAGLVVATGAAAERARRARALP